MGSPLDDLDEQALALLKVIQPGDFFVLRADRPKKGDGLAGRTICKCLTIEYPQKYEPLIKAREMEGPKGGRTDRMFRAFPISKLDRILKGSEI